MICKNCGSRRFKPIIAKGSWREGKCVFRRSLGIWSCRACGYGGTAFHSNLSAKVAYLVVTTVALLKRERGMTWGWYRKLVSGVFWREDRTA